MTFARHRNLALQAAHTGTTPVSSDGHTEVPTVLRHGPWRFFFYSNEGSEPPHIHVESSTGIAKFWLVPVALVGSRGISPRDLLRLERFIDEHSLDLTRAWNEYFGS